MTLSDGVRKLIQTIGAFLKISEQKLRELGFLIFTLVILVIVSSLVQSLADSYVQLLPQNISTENANTLLTAMLQVEGSLLAPFGFMFVAILTIIQSHIELVRREINEHHLSSDSAQTRHLSRLFEHRDYALILMAASVFSLVVSILLTLSNLASIGPKTRVELRGTITALFIAIFLVFAAIWLALRVRE